MSLKQTIYLALAVVALVIGIHRSTIDGIVASYWIFMLAVIFLMLFRMNKRES
ncbi:hypothetical protein [Rufibacter roseus]|uniref:Uncharacterized protein n=1 Tax=Rufibacter roseus TaxID=1567108 RepID=A0ABW2DIM6_9BACT|nr:hypothetical protein [Rufibacter roseus]